MARPPRHKRLQKSNHKMERMAATVTVPAKQLIQRAMAVSGLTVGDLAYEGARRVLDDHERMVLTGTGKVAFLDAVLNPPPPKEKSIAALKRHRTAGGVLVKPMIAERAWANIVKATATVEDRKPKRRSDRAEEKAMAREVKKLRTRNG